MSRFGLSLLTLVCFTAACSNSSPTAPSAPVAPSTSASSTGTPAQSALPVVTGATIAGQLQNGSPTASSSVAAAGGGATVTVSGTTLSATVDAAGRFSLAGVPSGTQQLVFAGGGLNGAVTLADLKAGDSVDLSLAVSGSDVSLESSRRRSGDEVEVEGRIESVPGSPAGSFVAAGRTILTDASTQLFLNGGTGRWQDIVVGARVHVKGRASGTDVLAAIVRIQNTNAELPVELNGPVSGLTGVASAFTFVVNGREVRGDGTTTFVESAFSDLANSVRVEVKGIPKEGFVQAQRIHVEDPTDDDDDTDDDGDSDDDADDDDSDDSDDDDADDADDDGGREFLGTLSSISGLTAAVGGRTVTLTSNTQVARRGDRYTVAVLRVGMRVEVSGMTVGGAFTAKKITIESEAFDVDVDGAIVGPITGGCAAGIGFKIGAAAMVTNPFTEFKKTACAALAVGTGVRVRGVRRADNSVVELGRVEVK